VVWLCRSPVVHTPATELLTLLLEDEAGALLLEAAVLDALELLEPLPVLELDELAGVLPALLDTALVLLRALEEAGASSPPELPPPQAVRLAASRAASRSRPREDRGGRPAEEIGVCVVMFGSPVIGDVHRGPACPAFGAEG
jgi:hypothetical protein